MTKYVFPGLILSLLVWGSFVVADGSVPKMPLDLTNSFVSAKIEMISLPASSSGQKMMHCFMLEGRTDLLYPFRLGWLALGDNMLDVFTEKLYATYSVDGQCVVKSNNGTLPEVQIWATFRELLTSTGYKLTNSGMISRGLDVVVFEKSLDLNIPVGYGGNGSVTNYKVEYHLLRSWVVNHGELEQVPVKILLTPPGGDKLLFTIFDFSKNTLNISSIDMPEECYNQKNVTKNSEVGPEQEEGSAMPQFPEDFTAYIQVIAPMEKRVWTLKEQFSGSSGMSHTTIYGSVPNPGGQVLTYDWYTVGGHQTSYLRVRKISSGSLNQPLKNSVRNYLFHDSDTCKRAQLGVNVTAGTSSALMLLTNAVPVYVGRQVVRGMPCSVWSATGSGYRVKWYWTEKDKVVDATGEDSKGTLMRMVVEGHGVPPYFAHHPFVANPEVLPPQYHSVACQWLNPMDPTCPESNTQYKYIYEIYSFVPFLQDDIGLPSSCVSAQVPSASLPDALEEPLSDERGLICLLLLIIISATTGGFVVWSFMASRVERVKLDVIRIIEGTESRGE
ncbi:unnamed protein product [Trypanosoma congolense IL3000]|uniref:WGS project CAEQ00000000 data, annotated contig 2278 n=1 Tax=Trypanosoma congolense (strain IL3000) TaxID=1068625 RepID=F9WCV5_TRYCI|nr:unnamed protein product [Trypanosoma congolense IL3000]